MKVAGAVALVVLLLFVVLLIVDGGHGPARHGDSGDGALAPAVRDAAPPTIAAAR